MDKASFTFGNYTFTKVNLDLSTIYSRNDEFQVDIDPSGMLDERTGVYELSLTLSIKAKEAVVIFIQCEATFMFGKSLLIEELPSFFYANAIAILFPYVRAFISTITLQANIHPFVLPTYNLSSLQSVLKEHTSKKAER